MRKKKNVNNENLILKSNSWIKIEILLLCKLFQLYNFKRNETMKNLSSNIKSLLIIKK